MPEANLPTFDLANATPGDLEARRRAIIADLTTKYRGFDDPDVPISLLQELATITASLRRKTAGPPKVAKGKPAGKTPATLDDLSV